MMIIKACQSFLKSIFSFIKSLFLNGLFTLLPITATIFFVNFSFRLIGQWLAPVKQIQPLYFQQIPGGEVLLVILFIILFGALLKFLVINPFIHRIFRAHDTNPPPIPTLVQQRRVAWLTGRTPAPGSPR